MHLHRAIENGHASDATWAELSTVCYRLGYIREAIRSTARITDDDHRLRIELWLSQKGVIEKPSGVQPAQNSSDANNPYAKPRQRGHLKGSSLREEIFDAISYLFLEHIPFTVMALTLTFPLVIGLGGLFTTGTEFWIFPAIALVPVLCIAMLVGSLAQQTLLEASHGFADPPPIADFPQLVRRSAVSGCATLAVAFVTLLPGVLMVEFLGANWLPLLIAGGILFPVALALCLTRKDLRGLHPKVLFPTMWRLGVPGIGATLAIGALFAPAIFAMVGTEGSALYLRLSLIGPLVIAPLFVSARLIGRIMYLSRDSIEDLMWTTPDTIDAQKSDPRLQTYSAGRLEQRRRSAAAVRAVSEVSTTVSNKQRKRRRRVDRLDAPFHPEQSQTPKPKPRPKSKPKVRRQQPRLRVSVDDLDSPAFSGFEARPGFRVLEGADRINAGAAARRPDKT